MQAVPAWVLGKPRLSLKIHEVAPKIFGFRPRLCKRGPVAEAHDKFFAGQQSDAQQPSVR